MKRAHTSLPRRQRVFTRRASGFLWRIAVAILLGGCGGGADTAVPATVGHTVALPTATSTPAPTMAMPSAMPMPTVAATVTLPPPGASAAPVANPSQPASAASPAAQGTAKASVEIKIVDFAFVPASVTVPVGTTVVWRLAEGYHTVVSADFRLNSPILEQVGASYSYTFTQEGVYDYVCGVHPEMLGVVQVVR